MTLVLTSIFFVFGLIIGSFLNVVIFRFNTGKSYGGRSKCLFCHKILSSHELVPVFSYIFLGGRCKGCKTRVSIQYPLVELGTALIFAGLFTKFEYIFYADSVMFTAIFAFYAIAFSLLVVISAHDARHKIIPDVLVACFSVLAFLGLFMFDGHLISFHLPNIWELLRGVFFFLPFFLLWLVSGGKWMGFGDAKLALGVGWLLSTATALSALMLAFWSGALVGLVLLSLKKMHGMKSELPFAPFLAIGAILAFLLQINLLPLGF